LVARFNSRNRCYGHLGGRKALPTDSAPPAPEKRNETGLSDQARFIRTWLGKPLVIGAVAPSGHDLARTMASAIDLDAKGPIVELGPGTGVVTQALLARGVAPSRLILIEYDQDFCTLLASRYPGVRIVQGDAYAIADRLRGVVEGPISAVVSSLPLLTRPEALRLDLLKQAFDLMQPDGRFVQFTYSIGSPMPRKDDPIAVQAEVSPRIWRNVPPARVWIYRRAEAPSIAPVFGAHASSVDRFEHHAEIAYLGLKKELKAAQLRWQRAAKARLRRGPPPAGSSQS
jgi:phosphatidylethanolamine/phosphatidyl-N-methylethanolamine N-methyltransferase